MTDIPDDVMKTAKDIANDYVDKWTENILAHHIARAIMAERERAAKVVVETVVDMDMAYAIAAAIRKGQP